MEAPEWPTGVRPPRAARLDTGLLNRPHPGELAVQPLVGQVRHGRKVLAQAAAHHPRTAAWYRLLHVDFDEATVGKGRGQPPAVVGDAHVRLWSVGQPGTAARVVFGTGSLSVRRDEIDQGEQRGRARPWARPTVLRGRLRGRGGRP
jgi:hypothetical protein